MGLKHVVNEITSKTKQITFVTLLRNLYSKSKQTRNCKLRLQKCSCVRLFCFLYVKFPLIIKNSIKYRNPCIMCALSNKSDGQTFAFENRTAQLHVINIHVYVMIYSFFALVCCL